MKKLEFMNEQELREFCNECGRAVVGTAASMHVEKPLFVLLLFNDPKLGQYVANCDRSTVVQALRETADRLEKREDIPR